MPLKHFPSWILTFSFMSRSKCGEGTFSRGRSLISSKKYSSHGASNNMPSPSLPSRPVLPRRCIYSSRSVGIPIW